MNVSGMLSLLTSSLTAMALPALASVGGGGVWLPERGSTSAATVDNLFYFIFWICLFFFTLLMALMVIFAIRYRRKKEGEEVEASPRHNLKLEVVWTTIPILLVVAIFFFGFRAYLDMSTAPRDAYEIQVTGQKWQWTFTYPNGLETAVLTVPAGRPVSLVMTSKDVIHSLSIPAFRIKMDVVPGRYTKSWFEAVAPGEYDLYCAEYCGTQHSGMITKVTVMPGDEFDGWAEEQAAALSGMGLAGRGEVLYTTKTCVSCHSLQADNVIIGPSFRDLFGSQRPLVDGTTVLADEDYIRESIVEPQAKVSSDRAAGAVMTAFPDIKDSEITALIAFMKSVSVHAPQEPDEGDEPATAGADSTITASDDPAAETVEAPQE